MKGRGVRKMDPNEFWAVTPGAREEGAVKDHFVIVDCVGLTDEDRAWAETRPLDRKPNVPLKTLLQDVAQGITVDELLSTVAVRLNRLQGKLTPDEEAELAELAGASLIEIAETLIKATDPDLRSASCAARRAGRGARPDRGGGRRGQGRADRGSGRAAAPRRRPQQGPRCSRPRPSRSSTSPPRTGWSRPASSTPARREALVDGLRGVDLATITTSTWRSRPTIEQPYDRRLDLERHQGAGEGDRVAAAELRAAAALGGLQARSTSRRSAARAARSSPTSSR